jgi:hypothetical protein
MVKETTSIRDNIVVVLKDAKTGRVEQIVSTKLDGSHNIVTTAGNRVYAQGGAGSTPFITIAQMTVAASLQAATAGATFGDLTDAGGTSTIPTGGTQNLDAGYPTTADADADNTGADSDVTTWLRTYTTTQANTNVKAIVLHQTGAATGNRTSTNLLLNAATLAVSVTKTSAQLLKVFVNHTFAGV